MGGLNFDRLYHKIIVIVKLQLHDAIYQLILLKLVDLYLIAFKFVQ